MKETVKFYCDSFVDYANNEHKITMALVVEDLPHNDNESTDVVFYDEFGEEYVHTMKVSVKLGIAICNPKDKDSFDKGKLIAENKAKNSLPFIYAPFNGFLDDTILDAIAHNQFEFVKNNISKYIKGYKEQKNKYLTKKAKEEAKKAAEEALTEEERNIVYKLKDKDTRNRVMNCL